MAKYDSKLLEEELKNKVAADWFAAFDTTRIIGKVDFCVAVRATELGLYESENALWAEAKAGVRKDIYESFVQLILTIGRARTFDAERPPFFLGAFDKASRSRRHSTTLRFVHTSKNRYRATVA